MEAKGSEDEAKDSKEEEPPSKVVIDLLNFAMKVVHEEMSGFFEQHCVLWDYKEEDLKKITAGKGETLEQHAVFTQYLEQINERLTGSRGLPVMPMPKACSRTCKRPSTTTKSCETR